MDRIIDLIYLIVVLLTAIGFYRLGKGEKVIETEKIASLVDKLKPKKKFKPEVVSWDDEDEANDEERDKLKRNRPLTDEEYFELAKKMK